MTAQTTAEKPTIKILLYTDDPNAISESDNLLGLSSMKERLEAHAPAFAKLSIKWVSRSSDRNHHADNKLDVVMSREEVETGAPFDEIWFFGLHQTNTEKFSLGVFRGGPASELDANEVDALRKWMNAEKGLGLGVLMTGDHNNPVPPNRILNTNGGCADTVEAPELLGLGRALGRCVPRAGALRKWDGPPSSRANDNLNTISSTGFQTDRVPQNLIHERFNPAGELDRNGGPHPLFFYQQGSFIDVFPDHRHEGELVIPDVLDHDVWPFGPNGQPRPTIVAFGTDRRTDKQIGLVSAYDGDLAGVGRIVADSSWHHYVNINLKGFPHPAPPDSNSDKIGQFYGNLAVWLAPVSKRRQMAQAMYWELADYTLLLEQVDDPLRTGITAYSLLERAASPCEIHELLHVFDKEQQAARRFPASENGWNTEEKLGSVLTCYHDAMKQAEHAVNGSVSYSPADISTKAFRRAMAAPGNEPPPRDEKRRTTMACGENQTEWTIEMKRDPKPNEPELRRTLVFCLNAQNGVVTGEVSDGAEGQFLSTVTGEQSPLENVEDFGDLNFMFMSLNFKWGAADMVLSGLTFKTPETSHFRGRFQATSLNGAPSNGTARALAGGAVEVRALDELINPGNGDTGTGTGQQT
jgi:hypothetical protein